MLFRSGEGADKIIGDDGDDHITGNFYNDLLSTSDFSTALETTGLGPSLQFRDTLAGNYQNDSIDNPNAGETIDERIRKLVTLTGVPF